MVVAPFALTNEFTVAELEVTKVAAWVWAVGALAKVVKVRSLPFTVPPLFDATIRKWYVVLGESPEIEVPKLPEPVPMLPEVVELP